MRKITILIICVLMAAILALPVSAAGAASLSASKTTAYRGDTVSVTVKLSGMSQCVAASIEVAISGDGLELTGATAGISGMQVSPNLEKKQFVVFAMSNVDINGNFAVLNFKVKAGASFADNTVSVTVQANGETLTASTKITVACKHNYGKWTSDGTGKHSHTCSICGDKETKNHSWKNACDTKCDDCGYTRTITHKYSTTYSTNAESHYYACTVCGNKKDVQVHTPGEPATEEHGQNCTVCGYEIAPKLDHVHQIQGEQLMDETGHWFDCGTCEEKAEFAEHTYEFECSTTCSVCGYQRVTEHTLAPEEERKWDSDENSHWHTCTVCGEAVDAQEHTSDDHPVTPACSVCGHSLQHVHSYADQWTCDGENHWHECACGEKTDVTAHTLGEGVLTVEPQKDAYGEMVFTCSICGGEKKALVVSAIPELLPWWIACGVLAVLFVGALIIIIVVIVKINKKPAGKFAGSKR